MTKVPDCAGCGLRPFSHGRCIAAGFQQRIFPQAYPRHRRRGTRALRPIEFKGAGL